MATLLALSSLVITLRPRPEPLCSDLPKLLEIGFSVAVMVLYALLLPETGYVAATALAAACLIWRLGTAPLWSLPHPSASTMSFT